MHRGIDPKDRLVKETDGFDFERPAVGILQDKHHTPKGERLAVVFGRSESYE